MINLNSSIGRWIYIVLDSSLPSADRKTLITFGSLARFSQTTTIALGVYSLSYYINYVSSFTRLHGMTCALYFFKDSSKMISLISFSP